MLVTAVVVNFNGREMLLACLASLQTALEHVKGDSEIVVVDNGSADGSSSAVAEHCPSATIVQLDANRGFAGGVEAGRRAATGEWLLLLNNDATIEPDAVAALLDAGCDPTVGSLAAQLRFAHGGALNSAGIGIDRLGVAFDRCVGEPPRAAGDAVIEVFGASAGAALMRRSMLEDIGGFDASFFLYLEDVDVAWRARMRGWRSLYVPAAVVHHHHSASSGHGSPFKHFHVARNRMRLLAKNMPTGQLVRHAPAILAYDLAHVIFTAATERTLAPLRGRIAGLREWRSYRTGGCDRRPVTLAPPRGVSGALRRRRGTLAGTMRR